MLSYYERELNFGGAEMDIYFEMAKHPVFTIEDVNLFYPASVIICRNL